MVVVTTVVVVMRYFLGVGWIWLQESVTWMHGTVFMLAAAYTFARDEHVRVDLFYRDMTPRRRAVVDLAGTLLLLLPLCAFLVWACWDYVAQAWTIREGSRESGGLPALFLLKSVLVAMPVLLAVQGLALALRSAAVLLDRDAC
jgi:TRAP-type mannitol/chloroaromatic compound transport system permease small subunit